MPYDAKLTRKFNHPADRMTKSVSEVMQRLGGKASKKSNPDKGYFEANFNKKIKSEYMNNRVQLEVKVIPESAEQCTVSAEAYPVNPVGQKLMFGVRGQPARFVIDTFQALECATADEVRSTVDRVIVKAFAAGKV